MCAAVTNVVQRESRAGTAWRKQFWLHQYPSAYIKIKTRKRIIPSQGLRWCCYFGSRCPRGGDRRRVNGPWWKALLRGRCTGSGGVSATESLVQILEYTDIGDVVLCGALARLHLVGPCVTLLLVGLDHAAALLAVPVHLLRNNDPNNHNKQKQKQTSDTKHVDRDDQWQ